MHRAQMQAEAEESHGTLSAMPAMNPVVHEESSSAALPPAMAAEPQVAEPAPRVEPERPRISAVAPAPAPAPVPAPSVGEARAELESSGLQMVETKSERSLAPEPEPATPLGRPRAERPRQVAEEEPLVQVETKH